MPQDDPAKKKKAEPKAKPKKAEPKKAEPKKETPARTKPDQKPDTKPASKHPQILEQAKAADIRLQAVLPNSKYARENKIKDIQAQLGLIGQLSTAERKELKLSKEALTKTLADLQKA